MNTSRLTAADIEVCRIITPLSPEGAWVVESFLLRIFEYGDYSFRSALSGEYSKALNCTFFLAKYEGEIVGAAGCLYTQKNPVIAIIGPVGVAAEYRENGIGRKLVSSIIKHLESRDCMAVYLGVSPGSSAASFFSLFGFEKYKGIVMRLLLCPQTQFEQNYFGKSADTKIRRATWGDFPGIQSLVSCPCLMHTVDFRQNIFSSKYVEPTKFLSVFPEMMRAFARQGGFANVLVSQQKENVVGLAQVRKLPGQAQRHIGELDFYVHDNFIEQAGPLVRVTLQESALLSVQTVNFYCLGCDRTKRDVIEALGGVHVATLPENILLCGKYEDVLVYQLKGKR